MYIVYGGWIMEVSTISVGLETQSHKKKHCTVLHLLKKVILMRKAITIYKLVEH